MKEEKIRVVTKQPGQTCEVQEISNIYEVYRDFVLGTIDMVDFPNREDISIVCNDDFLINGMTPNIYLPERKVLFCGPLMFTGFYEETGKNTSLNDEQLKTVIDYCKEHTLYSDIKVVGWDDSKKEMEM